MCYYGVSLTPDRPRVSFTHRPRGRGFLVRQRSMENDESLLPTGLISISVEVGGPPFLNHTREVGSYGTTRGFSTVKGRVLETSPVSRFYRESEHIKGEYTYTIMRRLIRCTIPFP